MGERRREIRDTTILCRNEIQRALITGAREVKLIVAGLICANRVERGSRVGSNAMQSDHDVRDAKHSIGAGFYNLTRNKLGSGWDFRAVSLAGILRQDRARSEDKRK
jgi:hypothetical protein